MGIFGRLTAFATAPFRRNGRASAATPPPESSPARVEATRALKDEITGAASPSRPGLGFWDGSADTPNLGRMLQDVEAMVAHPRVEAALGYYRGGVAQAKFVLEGASSPEAGEFALNEARRFWRDNLSDAQLSYRYGRLGAEAVYSDEEGPLRLDYLKPFPGLSARALLRGNDYFGVRVRQRAGETDLWGPSWLPAKGFWHAHNTAYSRWYGFPQVYPAWRPWRRLAGRDGGEDNTDAAVYRFAVRPPVGRYPKRDDVASAGNPYGTGYLPNSERMREFLENARSGATLSLSSERDEHGAYVWDVVWPEHVLDVGGLISYCQDLERQITLGVGVPPELLEASEVGSGYSGRAIPLEAFLTRMRAVAWSLLVSWYRQIGLPLLRWNYGPDAWARIAVEDMLLSRMKAIAKAQSPQQPQQPPPAPGQGEEGQAAGGDDGWSRYRGKNGGEGWRNAAGTVVYGDERPGGQRFATEGGDPWQPYAGKRGGKGWKNSVTGRIVYQEKKPGVRQPAAPKEPAPGRKPPPHQRADAAAVGARVKGLLSGKGPVSADDVRDAVEELMTLKVKDIKALMKEHGVKGHSDSGAEKLGERVRAAILGKSPAGEAEKKPEPAPKEKPEPVPEDFDTEAPVDPKDQAAVAAAAGAEPVSSVANLRKRLADELPGRKFDETILRLAAQGKLIISQDTDPAGWKGKDASVIRHGDNVFTTVMGVAPPEAGASAPKEEPKGKGVTPREADRLIGELEPHGTVAGDYKPPLPVDDSPGYLFDMDREERAAMLAASPVVEMPIDKLTATQDVVHGKSLRHQLTTGGGGEAWVIKDGGTYYLDDGTHRVVAASLRGDKTVKARLLDLDAKKADAPKEEPKPPEKAAEATAAGGRATPKDAASGLDDLGLRLVRASQADPLGPDFGREIESAVTAAFEGRSAAEAKELAQAAGVEDPRKLRSAKAARDAVAERMHSRVSRAQTSARYAKPGHGGNAPAAPAPAGEPPPRRPAEPDVVDVGDEDVVHDVGEEDVVARPAPAAEPAPATPSPPPADDLSDYVAAAAKASMSKDSDIISRHRIPAAALLSRGFPPEKLAAMIDAGLVAPETYDDHGMNPPPDAFRHRGQAIYGLRLSGKAADEARRKKAAPQEMPGKQGRPDAAPAAGEGAKERLGGMSASDEARLTSALGVTPEQLDDVRRRSVEAIAQAMKGGASKPEELLAAVLGQMAGAKQEAAPKEKKPPKEPAAPEPPPQPTRETPAAATPAAGEGAKGGAAPTAPHVRAKAGDVRALTDRLTALGREVVRDPSAGGVAAAQAEADRQADALGLESLSTADLTALAAELGVSSRGKKTKRELIRDVKGVALGAFQSAFSGIA